MDNSIFQFKGFIVRRSLINLNEGETPQQFTINFFPVGIIEENNSVFKLKLGVKIEDKKKVLQIEVDAEADYFFDKEISKKQLDNFFYVNAPALLFPYIRAYISTLTNLSGIKPITLPTLNLTELGVDLKENTSVV